jgi:hypothetical protein
MFKKKNKRKNFFTQKKKNFKKTNSEHQIFFMGDRHANKNFVRKTQEKK